MKYLSTSLKNNHGMQRGALTWKIGVYEVIEGFRLGQHMNQFLFGKKSS